MEQAFGRKLSAEEKRLLGLTQFLGTPYGADRNVDDDECRFPKKKTGT